MNKPRTRFAPSPTGALHVGGLRTALYSYALAKHSGGDFILRIEDTDKKRETAGSRKEIESLLKLFDLNWDEKYIQSERVKTGIYQLAAEKLIKDGHAFYCTCSAKNAKDGFSKELRDPCRDKNHTSGAIKLKVPDEGSISFHDFVLDKDITWENSQVADTTLLKSDGFPTYHLAVVVDDSEMNITHVLRGHDWLPSTPVHLLVYQFLGKDLPQIGHLTDIQDPEGGKLSKRKGSVSVTSFLQKGYLPEAILNFIMLLGWAPKDNREFFTLQEFVKAFNPNGFQKANPVLNIEKLNWFNMHYIQKLNKDQFVEYAINSSKYSDNLKFKKIAQDTANLLNTRITTFADYDKIAGFFFETPKVDTKLFGKNHKTHLTSALSALEPIHDWNLENINSELTDEIKKKDYKVGDFFMDLRIAITGSKFTPPINDSIVILGKQQTLKRIKSTLSRKSS